ncbi:hypothetical protein PanWU01x14_105760 [Parasponia andersonii]|uniref:Uncharacterized protein n=1 Tax=Parasponia andersonii TaxID=3476 RepID=A0A2P5D114_PARAD|nr:hypothetical protein PanWU01x14_105760 [Parasponia andersonii]
MHVSIGRSPGQWHSSFNGPHHMFEGPILDSEIVCRTDNKQMKRGNDKIDDLRDGDFVFSTLMACNLVSSALVASRIRERRMMPCGNHRRNQDFLPKTMSVFAVVLDEAAMREYRQVLIYFSVSNMKNLPP